jgi:hypothetical protein
MPDNLTRPGFTCRLCGFVLPAWMPLGDVPFRVDTSMLLGHLMVRHPDVPLGEIPDTVKIFDHLVPRSFRLRQGL